MPVHHRIYGLRVASDVSLPGVSLPGGLDAIDLRIRLREKEKFARTFPSSLNRIFYSTSNSNESGDANLRVGTLGDGGYIGFFYSYGVRFAVDREGREIWGDWPEGYALEDACTYLLGPVIAFALRLRGVTCLHASSVAIAGRAIALMGQPGAGKSTTAAAFAHLGYSILSDDVVVLDDRGDRFLVQPGYPRVNLWPESVRALFGAADALPPITPTWGKRYLPLDRNGHRFQATPLELGAIYILGDREAGLTPPAVTELTGSDALATLAGNAYVNYLLNRDMRAREFDVLGRVLAEVPVRRVRPLADPSRILDLCETIVGDARQFIAHETPGTSPEAN